MIFKSVIENFKKNSNYLLSEFILVVKGPLGKKEGKGGPMGKKSLRTTNLEQSFPT